MLHCLAEIFYVTKLGDNFRNIPMLGNWRHLQNIRQRELQLPIFRVFLQQFPENLPRLRSKLLKKLPFLPHHPIRPLPSRQHRRVECKVAEQIERIGIGFSGLEGEGWEVDAAVLEGFDDFGALFEVGPAEAEFFGIGGKDKGTRGLMA